MKLYTTIKMWSHYSELLSFRWLSKTVSAFYPTRIVLMLIWILLHSNVLYNCWILFNDSIQEYQWVQMVTFNYSQFNYWISLNQSMMLQCTSNLCNQKHGLIWLSIIFRSDSFIEWFFDNFSPIIFARFNSVELNWNELIKKEIISSAVCARKKLKSLQ